MGKEEGKIKTVVLPPFSSGLNTDLPDDEQSARWALNVMYYGDRLRAGPAFVPGLNGPIGGNYGTQTNYSYIIGTWYDPANRFSIPVVTSTRATPNTVYSVAPNTSGGTLFPFTAATGLYTDITGTASITGSACVSTQHLDGLGVGCLTVLDTSKTTNPVYLWNGVGNLTVASGAGGVAPPNAAKAIASYNGYCWLGNLLVGAVRKPNWIVKSIRYSSHGWDDAATVYFDMGLGDSDEITAMAPLGPDLVVYRRNSISKINGFDLTDFAVTSPWVDGVGCILPKSLQSIPLQGPNGWVTAHIFFSTIGLCIFDGYSVRAIPLTEDNQGTCKYFFDAMREGISLTTNITAGNELSYSSAVDAKRGIYYLFGPNFNYTLPPGIQGDSSSGETYTASGIAYSCATNTVWPIEYQFTPQGAEACVDGKGMRRIIVGGPYEEFSELAYNDQNALIRTGFSETGLVQNGSMEANSDWLIYGVPTSQAQDAAQYRNGSKSWKVVGDSGTGSQQTITLTASKLYRISGWCYTPAKAGSISYVKVRDGATTLATITFTATAGAKWQFGYADFQATSVAAPIVTLESGTTTGVAADKTFYFDDVHVFLHAYKSQYRTCDLSYEGINTLKNIKELAVLAGVNCVNDNTGVLDVSLIPDGVIAGLGDSRQKDSTATLTYTAGTNSDLLVAVPLAGVVDFRRLALRFTTTTLSSANPTIGNPFPPIELVTLAFSIFGERFV